MSTRAIITIKDESSKQCFYRHSDGYPEGTMPTLNKFLRWVKDGKIRDNVSQSAGWLVIIGHEEYNVPNEPMVDKKRKNIDNGMLNWKVGSYEPCGESDIGGWIEYHYIVDLVKKEITIEEL